MYSTLPYLRRRLSLRMAKRGTSVTLNWVTMTNVTEDPTTGARLGTATPQSETVQGWVHFPNVAQTELRVFEEIEQGDCIADLPPNTVIEGREQLTFAIDGQTWVQKKISEQLARHWEVQHGQRLYRTVLLTKQR